MSVKFELDFRMITQKMKFLILGQPPSGTHSTSYIQSIIDRVKTDSRSTIMYFFQKNPEMISGVDEVIRRIDRIFPHNRGCCTNDFH